MKRKLKMTSAYKDKVIEALLVGYGRKCMKIAFEEAASRKMRPDLIQAERLIKTLRRTERLLRALMKAK